MRFGRFQDAARRMLEEIPERYREGIVGLVVEHDALSHPALAGIFTLGECVTESWPDGLGGQGELQSRVILYYGSFRELAADDPLFDWDAELWETIVHEILHHRESAASEAGLEIFDWAVDQNYLRHAGREFDPCFHHALPPDDDGAFRLDGETFVDALTPPGRTEVGFRWRGKEYTLRVPQSEATRWVRVRNLAGGRLWVVVRRRLPWWRRMLSARPTSAPSLERRALPPRPA